MVNMPPTFEPSPIQIALLMRLEEFRRQGTRMVLVVLDDNLAVRAVGRRENLADSEQFMMILGVSLGMTTEGI
jgi:hypothetical protein